VSDFIGSDWLPEHALADLFHWPIRDEGWLAEDECPHGRLPTDKRQLCDCWVRLGLAA
jgi:hypothetical protein